MKPLTLMRRALLIPCLPGDYIHDIQSSYGRIVIPWFLAYFEDYGFRRVTKFHNCSWTGIR